MVLTHREWSWRDNVDRISYVPERRVNQPRSHLVRSVCDACSMVSIWVGMVVWGVIEAIGDKVVPHNKKNY